jgi:hypothetical protein
MFCFYSFHNPFARILNILQIFVQPVAEHPDAQIEHDTDGQHNATYDIQPQES